MENFINLISEVWNTGFLGIDLGSIISSLLVILIAFLFRGFIISIILNALGRLADKTKSKIDDEILNALRISSSILDFVLSASLPRAFNIIEIIKPLKRKAIRITNRDEMIEPRSIPKNPVFQTSDIRFIKFSII